MSFLVDRLLQELPHLRTPPRRRSPDAVPAGPPPVETLKLLALGYSWTPYWLIDCLVNVGTTRGSPPGCPSWTGRGQVRCRLMAVGWGGGLVVVAGVTTR